MKVLRSIFDWLMEFSFAEIATSGRRPLQQTIPKQVFSGSVSRSGSRGASEGYDELVKQSKKTANKLEN
jgi:hypothetical protein